MESDETMDQMPTAVAHAEVGQRRPEGTPGDVAKVESSSSPQISLDMPFEGARNLDRR